MSTRTEPYRRRGRCVHCSGDAGDGKPCRYGKSGRGGSHATLDLPEGKTCGDCHFIAKCQALFDHIPADKTCDFYPVRFLEAPRGEGLEVG